MVENDCGQLKNSESQLISVPSSILNFWIVKLYPFYFTKMESEELPGNRKKFQVY